jgi:hypothetical protein
LSPQARLAFLNDVKAPAKNRGPGRTRPHVPVDAFPPGVLEELVKAGFVELGSSRLIGPRDRVFAVEGVLDFTARVRALNRYHLLRSDDPSLLLKYVSHVFFQIELATVLNGVIRSAGFQEYLGADQILSRYVTSRRWPGWVAKALKNPNAQRVLEAIQDAGGPIAPTALSEKLRGIAPESLRGALDGLITHLAVFEDLDPQTHDIVIGLLPAVREALSRALLPRQRPPLLECAKPKAVGPEGSVIVDDLRAFLLEVASEPPRLRQDRALFQKEVERFQEALGTLPSWLSQALSSSPERRLSQAFGWARGLKLVSERMEPKHTLLQISPKGSQWLSANLDEQYRRVFEVFHALPTGRDSYSYGGDSAIWIDSLGGYGRGDDRFLGSDVVVMKARKDPQFQRYWEAKPEDFQALRDALDRTFGALPVGVFYRLDSVLDHMTFGEHNPLSLGIGPESVLVFQSGLQVPPLEERREEVARGLLDTLIRRRLIPLGCLQTAVDEENWLYVARHPRLDAYFGRTVESAEMAGMAAGESRVVVQPDFSIVIIGLNPTPAAQLAPFCERAKRGSGQGALVLKLTRESVVKAVAHGLKPSEIVDRLKRQASNEVPANVLRQVQDWGAWVRKARTSTLTVITCPDSETADRVQAAMKKQAQRLNETMVAVGVNRLTSTDRNKLRDQGIIVEGL